MDVDTLALLEHYPQAVREMVDVGFKIDSVLKAYSIVGDHVDDLLSVLTTTMQDA